MTTKSSFQHQLDPRSQPNRFMMITLKKLSLNFFAEEHSAANLDVINYTIFMHLQSALTSYQNLCLKYFAINDF